MLLRSAADAPLLAHRCFKNAFWIVSLLYPNIAQTALQLFSHQKLDIGTYLRADYQVLTRDTNGVIDPTYQYYVPPGIIILILFAIGLPIVFFYVLWRVRDKLDVCALHQLSIQTGLAPKAHRAAGYASPKPLARARQT